MENTDKFAENKRKTQEILQNAFKQLQELNKGRECRILVLHYSDGAPEGMEVDPTLKGFMDVFYRNVSEDFFEQCCIGMGAIGSTVSFYGPDSAEVTQN